MPIPGGPRPSEPLARPLPEVADWAGTTPPPDAQGVVVTGVTLSSRTVRPGDLYAALPGSRAHGGDFAGAAAQAGAVALLTDAEGARRAADTGLPALVVPDPRAVLGGVCAHVYGLPAQRLLMLGVTGTNGKTTTTFLLDAALRAAGHRTGMVGTVEIRVGSERVESSGTTPEAPDLHALFAVMLEHGVDTCAMEISSHALHQHRVDGLVLDVAGFTNLSQDHLDYHPSMEHYFATKAQLFTAGRTRRAVVCIDDDWGRRLAGQVARAGQVPLRTVATVPGAGADWQVREAGVVDGHPQALVRGPDGVELVLRSPLPGDFNLANSLVALGMLVEAGMPAVTAAEAIAADGHVPGRMERVSGPGAPGEPLAVVDYAHSPDAVRVALQALQGGGRPLVVVLGAGGDRDREKRPLMGAAAVHGADVVVVTDDNPRSEEPAAIRGALLAGAREAAGDGSATVLEIADRRAAIAEGVRRAWGGGVLLVAGKGHEQGQEIAGQVHPFDDRIVLREALHAVPAPVPAAARTASAQVPAGTGTDVEGTDS
ncbi:MAG TPA: UDP-N-acetylmuramoyl-L-alanyl-D-glutamate--2,6-diaminopimelate ligase [Kineosporiaceae bacterium]|nr:UDP-N-acetylmuramoyl-L-alanyl-D-glutamate--2,6-diaminopimelate ligase [Kineosporiaceae bacterium]